MELKLENESNKYEATTGGTATSSELPCEDTHDGHKAIAGGRNAGSSFTSSSSSSGSALELNSAEEDPLVDSYTKADLHQSSGAECTSPPGSTNQIALWSMVNASPQSGPGNSPRELLPPTPGNLSPMKSPITQTMSRPTGYDPHRIPSSIFSTRPTTPMEWSVASNESLFSIHMGNSSFSRDNLLMMEDIKEEQWSSSSFHMHSVSEAKSESNNFTTNLPPVLEAAPENGKRSADTREELTAEEKSQKPSKMITGETVEQHEKEKIAVGAQEARLPPASSNVSEARIATAVDVTRPSVSIPRMSNESRASSGSFAFPVLDAHEGRKSVSLKAIAEKPEETQSLTQDPQPSPKAAQSSWFSCFSCWPKCCTSTT